MIVYSINLNLGVVIDIAVFAEDIMKTTRNMWSRKNIGNI